MTIGGVMQRLGSAIGAGMVVGVLAALVAGAMFEPFELIGTWGWCNGIVAGVLAFVVVLARGRGRLGIVGRWGLALFLAGLCWWAGFFAVRTPPLSLEGAWIWPLAVLVASAFVATVRWAWRSGAART